MERETAMATKHITLNVATSTDPPSSSQFAAPSPLKSYVLTRYKKRTAKTDERSSAADSRVSPSTAEGYTGQEDSDIAVGRAGTSLRRSHVCSWETEREQRIGLLKRAGGGGGVIPRHTLYMSGQGAHIHQQQPQHGTLKEAVWTPNADLYYGKGIKAAHIKTKPKPGASLGKSAQPANDVEATPAVTG